MAEPTLATARDVTSTRRASAWLRRPLLALSLLVLALLLTIAVVPGPFASLFGNGDPRDCQLTRSLDPASPGHPFGFDRQGCDLYANVIHGARSSLGIGLLSATLMTLIAVLAGLLAGYYGGLLDAIIGRICDILFGFPFMLGAIVILTALPERNAVTMSLVLAAFSWPYLARVVRSSVIGVLNLDYVMAARSLGASPARLMLRHILPNAAGPAIVVATMSAGGMIVAESGLTFLGIGLQVPAISWGLQISDGQSQLATHPALLLYPSVFISATVLAFVIIGDALRAKLDPHGQA